MLRALSAVVVVATLGAPGARAVEEFGLELPLGTRRVGDHRWQVERNYDAAVKFFREKFRGSKNVRWMREVSLPGVKYVHVQNINEASAWEGLNIYRMADGSVRLYFLERRAPAATTSAPPAPAATTAPTKAPPAPAAPR
jgi:hypothetical protein